MKLASVQRVDRKSLLDFARSRHRGILTTVRGDGRPQLSPVTMGLDAAGRVVVSTYPERSKVRNLRRDPRASLCVLSDEWDGPDRDGWLPATTRGRLSAVGPAEPPARSGVRRRS